jgi:SET domain-containing protein
MGSKINHSWTPNAQIVKVKTPRPNHTYLYFDLRAIKDIPEGEEITVDYREHDEFKDPHPNWK